MVIQMTTVLFILVDVVGMYTYILCTHTTIKMKKSVSVRFRQSSEQASPL